MAEIDFLPAIGLACLGAAVGLITGIFAFVAEVDGKYIGAALTGIGGTAVLGALGLFANHGAFFREMYFYPMGLLAGILLGFIISHLKDWA